MSVCKQSTCLLQATIFLSVTLDLAELDEDADGNVSWFGIKSRLFFRTYKRYVVYLKFL